ncbi:hypothetical protein GLOIN_2v1867148 [Rhizophagus irregularis DAOM 181602=DAOM 197198]|uniref:Uncharacterized protein n=1 Tax=Rhizophagus irregularis (strain DAOM 181602 / DAOM 197198 / MUCL 43194) TaxID=747089 RepID=A0A2P4QYU3_RHIID|nr:hypothetical protein GLOIN_2v1867148 [Rhizophagus irregularis DAOM 181602=DAOM 197198]POG82821.1 hypothetical protein GLOIN_2v1867148 [Rhizophagus irregularis DAOM 181602=DAOM 197198]|eukprot:XP_025189687.1 hypothetical protein GLOIN_2v1867148 [Rhizophagus irregularis DAOM 181602=DAOM 197198]
MNHMKYLNKTHTQMYLILISQILIRLMYTIISLQHLFKRHKIDWGFNTDDN